MCTFACVLAGHTCLIIIDFEVFPLFISVVSSLQYNCYIKYFKHLGSANKISFLNEQSLLCFIIGKVMSVMKKQYSATFVAHTKESKCTQERTLVKQSKEI